MTNIIKNKTIGMGALVTINGSLNIKYDDDYIGITEDYANTTLTATMVTNTNEVAVGTLMDAYETVTCTSSLLAITLNMGTVIVNDITNVTADPTDKKFVLIAILLDDITGDAEPAAFEKTTGEYAGIPAGKTLGTNVKEYSVAPAGTTLILVKSYI